MSPDLNTSRSRTKCYIFHVGNPAIMELRLETEEGQDLEGVGMIRYQQREGGVTLVGFLRGSSSNVYINPERIGGD